MTHMQSNHLTIGFVRRGFSSSGGAESYLQRLAAGVKENGHEVRLFSSSDWPANQWSFGPITRVRGGSATAFANEMEKLAPKSECDVLMSLERIWRCDLYRAGDGVHRAWLNRRAQVGGPWQRLSRILNRKHAATLALEKSLFADGGARRVIANSRMVKEEIAQFYGYPPEKMDVVYNGVPLDAFRSGQEDRVKNREAFGLGPGEVGVLFAGSGWERKGLRFAIEAIENCGKQIRLLVAGRGDEGKFSSARLQFLGVVSDMPALYGAADIFLLPTIYDPFSNACLEALAAGLPVITTRANGFCEVIEAGVHGAILDDPRDIDAICEALRFWSEPAHREEARRRNLDLASRFDISANVRETLAILTR
jgi:UDP-glucose:(heptosyl)LPS alpha-1,3-glucosyltransferase